MITQLAKAKDNWFFKILSALVAVSFISLFGVTGYINSASQNQTVVKVGKQKVTQSEFSYRLGKEINALKKLAGDDFEITDEMRTTLTEGVLQQIIDENVLDQSMVKYGIYFPKAFVQQVIFQQQEFLNPLNGQFHPELFKRYLSSVGMSEEEYVATIKRALARKMMISDAVQTFGVPQVLTQAIRQMDNQRKTFKYTLISPDSVKIERKISDEEIQQYFADFGEQFVIPEQRSVKVLFVPNDIVIQKFVANDSLVKEYFEDHKKELNQPEKREILQMVFLNKDAAEKAYAALQNGQDFVEVAKEYKAENADEASLGVVAQDELADDLAAPSFEMNEQETRLLEVADTWQVIRVQKIIPAKEAVFEEAKPQIIETLSNENLYEALHDVRNIIDDAVNAGQSLEDVAPSVGGRIFNIANIREDTVVSDAPEEARDFTQSLDFNELVFSYGLDEITSAEEFDNGIVVVQVSNIIDEHMPEINDVKDEIIALWTVQEKNALAKETADNIVADVEDGSELAVAAKARDLEVFRSSPISRNETFANLSNAEISELFLTDANGVKMFEHIGNNYIIAVPAETINYEDTLTDDDVKEIQVRAARSLFSDMSQAALDSYAKDFKIKIDYQRAGFTE